MRLSYLFVVVFFVIDLKSISSISQFCSTLHPTTKDDNCPNPANFDLLNEYSKALSSWKLDIPNLTNKNESNVLGEIRTRFTSGLSCPYIRQTNKTVCCDGWQGLACDQPSTSISQQSFATCHLWSQDYIRTFDGTYYQFPGSCTYKLIGAMRWQINIQFINCTSQHQTCEKKLTVVIGGKTLDITGTKLLTNVTNYPSSLTIRRQEKNYLDLDFANGIRLKIDSIQQTILVQIEKNLAIDQSLSGLCGDYNNNQEDDLKLFNTGSITSVAQQFGNQWKLDRNCPDVPPVINDCSITPSMINECLSLTSQSSVFQTCFSKIDPTYFYKACLNDICSAQMKNQSITRARCQALAAYADECQQYNIRPQWRSETDCTKHCISENMIYSECVSSCPRTCQNPSLTASSCQLQTTDCTSGCVCSNDTVYDSLQDECVPLDQCQCHYNNDQYQPGDKVLMDCNECACDHGRWLCTNRTCPRTCSVLGDMNILTFDGKRYALVSLCNQILVETNDQSNSLRVTYAQPTNELTIEIVQTKIVLRENQILLNGNIRHSLPYQLDHVIIRHASTVLIEVRDIQSNFIIHFDPLTFRIYIKLQPTFVNRVRGLCGTFNYITNDDFLTPNNVIETNLVTFANAYLTSACSVPDQQTDTCLNFPVNEQHARTECTNLLKHPIFSTCSPAIIDPSFYLTSCIRDLCADQSSAHRNRVKCSVLSALAHACASKGLIIDWMSNETLAQSCQLINYGQCQIGSQAKYSECVSACRSTCTDIDLMPSSCEQQQCLPGCTCPQGQFFDEQSSVCRRQSECSCYEPYSEQYIHPFHSVVIQTPIVSNCSCSNASLQCSSFSDHQCSSNQIYSLNTTLCPRTCSNYLSYYDCGLYGPGCTCPPGEILLDSSQCIRIDQCPCQYNRQYYLVNQSILQTHHGRENCTCQLGGVWSCEKMSYRKTCTIFGHAYYQTFDGLYYKFPGQCQYVLVQDSNNLFRILTENIPCGLNGQICSKNLLIEYNGVVIDLVRDRPILFNNIELLNYQNQPIHFGNIFIYQLGIYTIVKTDDFLVKWDGQTYAQIEIDSSRETLGLCGNNNDNTDDDFRSANGATQINVFDMAQSWQTSIQCTTNTNQSLTGDPCGDSPEHAQRRTWAQTKCDLIKIRSSIDNNPFSICIEKMETSLIEKYYQACLYDACHADHGGDCESVCTVLSAFAAECQTILKTSIPQWRNNDRCPRQCDSGKVYMTCGPLCPQSCFEDADEYGGCIADSGCVDGCFCPNGQVMDSNGQCIEPKRCPCSYNNQIYPQSSRILMPVNESCQQECECQNGTFQCDESISCSITNCTSSQFRCQSTGQCIPLNWICDGVNDCQDASDEKKNQCQNQCLNKTQTFQCSNQQCIPIDRRCDGLPDCRDGSDELNCSYIIPCEEYQCPISKICIPKIWICDGTIDCGPNDNSDEGGDCKFHQCDIQSGRYFQCHDKYDCLPIDQRCDAHKDCNDGSDEFNCSSCTCSSSFSCLKTCQCIDTARVCDGVADCIDGTDEWNCSANCAKNEYTCLNGQCLNRTYLCDGIRHCSKGEDETHPDCSMFSTTTTTPSTTSELSCDIQSVLMDDRFVSEPEFSTPIFGKITELNPNGKGIDFIVYTPATRVTMILPLKPHVKLTDLVKVQILRPSNVNRFRLTFLNRHRQPVGHYQILSSNSQQSSSDSPTIGHYSIEKIFINQIQFIQIDILDTDDNRAPKRVTLLFQACFKQTQFPQPKETCKQIDAMDSHYTTRLIAKLGGTRPFNLTYGHYLQNYGGVTYNTSQAVIDIRFHRYILSRLYEISIPDFELNRTNVRQIIVELFDQNHKRLFSKTTNTMKISLNSTKKIHIRFIRISIVQTSDNYAPYNVTVSVKGCFYRRKPIEKLTTATIAPITTTTKAVCFRANALDPQYAYKIIGQIEGTQPLSNFTYVNFIEPGKTGVDYASRTPVVRIRFQSNVVGQLDEIVLINSKKNNIKQFQIDLFDYNNDLLFSNQTIYPENRLVISNALFVSTVQLTVLNTIDNLPVRGLIFSIVGCFHTFPSTPTTQTTTTTPAPTTTTTVRPRQCDRMELMNDSRIIVGVTSSSQLIEGRLGEIGRTGITFSDFSPSIDIVFRSNILIYLNTISILSSTTNLKRFRVELLNNENFVQYKIESSSMTINLESLPSIVLAGIRLTFLQTQDNQPPKDIRLSIDACVKEIFIQTSRSTTAITTTPATVPPSTTPVTPDHCIDIDAMQQPYSEKTLAGLSGTNPDGMGTSLVDLIHGKSIFYPENLNNKSVLFIIFKSNLFVYLKSVNLTSNNVKRLRIEYLDENHLLIRNLTIDYSTNQLSNAPVIGVGSIKFTIEETFDGKSAKNIRLSIRGCFGIEPVSTTTTVRPTIPITSTPCHNVNLMSNKHVATQAVAYIAGTNPSSSSISDYFDGQTLISYSTNSPTFIIVFKNNIYVDLKSISLIDNDTNVRLYQIDLIDFDQTILQTILVDRQQNQSNLHFDFPIGALKITYLQTIDGQTPKNILLNIDGCFGINLGATTKPPTSTRPPIVTVPQCQEIDMMNKLDSTILIESITGTLPTNRLADYFNQTATISYTSQQSSIYFLMILKTTVYAELHSVSLSNFSTNVKRFRIDLIDDYKSIVQTIESDENLTVSGLTEVAIAAIRITYLETNDNQPPRNIRLIVKGCFGILPTRRRTTTIPSTRSSTTTQSPQKQCTYLDAMTDENRRKILRLINGYENLDLFSSTGLSFNSTIDLAFQPGVIGHIENLTIIGNEHNIKTFHVTFFDVDNQVIDERILNTNDGNRSISIDNVAMIRVVFLETTDNQTIRRVKLSLYGCFFKIPGYQLTKSTSSTRKSIGYCRLIDLMNEQYRKRILDRIGGTISLPGIYNSSESKNNSKFFILEFNRKVFIRNIQNISLGNNQHAIKQIRLEFLDIKHRLLKHFDLTARRLETINSNLFVPSYPMHVKYLKITILKGEINDSQISWSIIGCFDRLQRTKTIITAWKYAWWTVSCIHSNILASRLLNPYITGTPLPIGGHFQNLFTNSLGVSYAETTFPIMIEIVFPPGIIGRLYEVGIRSSNVYRIRVQLVEVPNGLLYTLTSSKTKTNNPNPRLTGFPPVHSSAIRIFLLDTIDGRPPRQVRIYTNGCFYRSSVRYTSLPTRGTTSSYRTNVTSPPANCSYSEWTRWGHCSVSCGNGVQIRARNRLSGSACNDSLFDYRMCQLQPCTCVMTKEFYTEATGQQVPINNIVGYLKDGQQAVHIGDSLDTETIVYADNCLQLICSNVGLDIRRSPDCEYKCVYLSWSPWSPCQGNCTNKAQQGFQIRQRSPLRLFLGSHLCKPQTEQRSCQTPPCFGTCKLSPWSKWTRCSKSCGLGSQTRSRSYLSVQPNCTDELEETRDCNPQCCMSDESRPNWSDWSSWSNCSRTCNGGERVRSRICLNSTSQCQQELTCQGDKKQIEPCNTNTCPYQTICTNGMIMSNCSNACGHTCQTLTCRSCNEPSVCIPGCVCPEPLVLNGFNQCIDLNQCLCPTSDGKSNLVDGQRMTDSNRCEDCLCSNGCLNCQPSTSNCSPCPWSEWSPFGICSDKCNGTQTRYRSRTCQGKSIELDYDHRSCSTNETSYKKGCEQCSCDSITGQETCHIQCAITPSICSNLSTDPFTVYEYLPATDGECCGTCQRTNKTEPCSVHELPMEQLSIGDCISIEPIARQQCLGTCISGMICRCCSPSKVIFENVTVQCQRIENEATKFYFEEKSYAKIHACSCQECSTNI